jgi:ribosome-associated protein
MMNDTDSPLPAAANLPDAQTVAHLTVDAASDKKAQDIVLLDVRQVTTLADYFMICTATSERQLRAVADGIEEALDRLEVAPLHREGKPADGWMLLDYGDVVVHIFAPAQRQYYRLEKLWDAATTVVRVQ